MIDGSQLGDDFLLGPSFMRYVPKPKTDVIAILLTHVSLMIAGIAFVYQFSDRLNADLYNTVHLDNTLSVSQKEALSKVQKPLTELRAQRSKIHNDLFDIKEKPDIDLLRIRVEKQILNIKSSFSKVLKDDNDKQQDEIVLRQEIAKLDSEASEIEKAKKDSATRITELENQSKEIENRIKELENTYDLNTLSNKDDFKDKAPTSLGPRGYFVQRYIALSGRQKGFAKTATSLIDNLVGPILIFYFGLAVACLFEIRHVGVFSSIKRLKWIANITIMTTCASAFLVILILAAPQIFDQLR